MVLAGCVTNTANLPAELAPQQSGSRGYLAANALPDGLGLLPAPPADGSPAAALDLDASRAALLARATPRWQLAASDADLSFPHAPQAFSCALGVSITSQVAPHLVELLKRSLIDAGAATGSAKNRYRRSRPFMVNGEATCTPEDEGRLRTSGSYPSGHAAIGWAWALILTEIAPDRTDAILKRGRAFGESRVICNAHWPSDVAAGQLIGAAVVARLHGDAAFRAALDASRAELVSARRSPAAATPSCSNEASLVN